MQRSVQKSNTGMNQSSPVSVLEPVPLWFRQDQPTRSSLVLTHSAAEYVTSGAADGVWGKDCASPVLMSTWISWIVAQYANLLVDLVVATCFYKKARNGYKIIDETELE